MNKHLEIVNLQKSYGGKKVLSDFSLSVADGQFIVILGPSGCGKSTLLRLICGLEVPEKGSIMISGVDVGKLAPKNRNIAMVFQNYALYPHKTVYQNLALGLRMKKMKKTVIDAKIKDVSEKLGINRLLDRKPATLSGGEMQRVAVGRALTKDPVLFLFDEPLSNLDANLRNKLRGELKNLHHMLKVTTLYVTHDQVEAMSLGDKIVIINKGEIQQIGTPQEIFKRPVNTFVAQFIGSPPMNILDVKKEGSDLLLGSTKIQEVKTSFSEKYKLKIGVRPSDLKLGDKGIECTLRSIDYQGSNWIASVELEGQIIAIEMKERPPDNMNVLKVNFPVDEIQFFDAHSGNSLA